MKLSQRPWIAIAVLTAAVVAGCGSSSEPSIPVSGRHESLAGSTAGQIVLSQLGAQRIGLQTARVQAVPAPKPPPPIVKTTVVGGVKHTTTTPAPTPAPPANAPTAIIPYSAIVYAATGQTYAFTSPGPLTYVEVPVSVARISGNSAYLVRGPKPGTEVVSVGAEELFGVQSGVLAQT